MKKTIIHFKLIMLTLTLGSCASIFNSEQITTKIVTNEPTKLTINGQSDSEVVTEKEIQIDRSKKPLEITAESSENKKTITVEAKKSTTYWANFANYCIGMLIDQSNERRFTYPRTIYIDLNDSLTSYHRWIPFNEKKSLKNQIKITPLKIIGFFNPGLELAYERTTSSRFSTQIMGSILYKNSEPYTAGYRVAVEEKYFYKKTAPAGPYLGFELNYLQKKDFDTDTFVIESPNSDSPEKEYNDEYSINKKTVSLNVKWGYQKFINQFVLDFYVGLGLKYRNVKFGDLENANAKIVPGFWDPFLDIPGDDRANEIILNIPLNFKIGWAF